MPIDKTSVEDLKRIHKVKTGEKLTEEEVWEMATRLLEFGEVVLGGDDKDHPEPRAIDVSK